MLHDLVLPILFTIAEQPLITEGYNAGLSSTGSYLLLWLIVRNSVSLINHQFSDKGLRLLNFHTSILADLHHTFVETFVVALIFGLIKLLGILVRLNFSFFDGEFGTNVAHAFDLDDGDGVESLNPFLLNVHPLSETLLLLEVTKHSIVVRCI